MKTLRIDTPNGAIAVHNSAGEGPAVVLVHGNSSSSRAFSRQLEGPLGRRFQLIAVDLPGHGESDDAKDPGAYSLPGHARAVRAVVDALGLGRLHFAGWSLGGHVVLEMAPDLAHARGLVIFGAPPLPVPAAMSRAFRFHPAMKFTFQESIEALAYVAAFFKPGFADVPAFFLKDVLRTDRRARSRLGASVGPGLTRDEVAIVRDLEIPLAVLHGAEDRLVNAEYLLAPQCRRCGAARCRWSPAPGMRRNGRRRRRSTRSSKRSLPRPLKGFSTIHGDSWADDKRSSRHPSDHSLARIGMKWRPWRK